jgi:hypothetical protein
VEAIQCVTSATDQHQTITSGDAQEYIEEGGTKVAAGDFMGMVNLLYGAV